MARSLLSVLGVVIGIAAVITVLSIGAGAKARILDQISSMGTNVYTLTPRYDETTMRMGSFELEDVKRLSEISFVAEATPQLNLYKSVRSRSLENHGNVIGVDNAYFKANRLRITRGRIFSPIEDEQRGLVCLISEKTVPALFEDDDRVLGQMIYIDGLPWQVIGVYAREREVKLPRRRKDGEVEILMPTNALLRNAKDVNIQSVEVQLKPDTDDSAKDELLRVMERDDPKRKNLFYIRNQKDLYARSLEMQNTLSMIGALVAGISLIVGGIGMMNVMLTSVAERTREIGVRRAVGARKKDILFQFLVESCVLSAIGGTIGLLAGAAMARGLPMMFKEFFDVAPRMQPSFLVLAVGTGVTLGILFGFYPAVKASKLAPAEALRTE